jgi:hypothetical protein
LWPDITRNFQLYLVYQFHTFRKLLMFASHLYHRLFRGNELIKNVCGGENTTNTD